MIDKIPEDILPPWLSRSTRVVDGQKKCMAEGCGGYPLHNLNHQIDLCDACRKRFFSWMKENGYLLPEKKG